MEIPASRDCTWALMIEIPALIGLYLMIPYDGDTSYIRLYLNQAVAQLSESLGMRRIHNLSTVASKSKQLLVALGLEQLYVKDPVHYTLLWKVNRWA